MRRQIFKRAVIGALTALTIYSMPILSEAAQEIVTLEGQEKQDYIYQEMRPFLRPKEGEIARIYKFEVPKGWNYERLKIGEVSVERLIAKKPRTQRVILQLHGGGYTQGLGDLHRAIGLDQAKAIDAKAIYYVDYRLAPQYKYPAALEDAVAVYKDLLTQGIDAKNIVVIGDSAGGNLTLGLSLYLKQHNINQPGALILISPWATFEHDKDTTRYTNKDKDLILGEKGSPLYDEVMNPSYANGLNVNDPKLSPIYADLSNLPPMLIQVGGYELFLDDGLSLIDKSSKDGVDVTLTVYPEMSHDFSILLPELKESFDSLREIKDFVNRHMK